MECHTLPSLLLALTVATATVSAVPLIRAPWGDLQGVSVEGDRGRKMNGYLGIPYAVPPLGVRRFEKPLPHPGPGKGNVFVADQIMPACPQPPMLIGESRKTSEDCLMLDVYVPANGEDGPYAVMVFIHGGGFTTGDAYSYRPSKLVVDGRVIVVVIQYRLGPFGFLSSGDGTLPGNAGLWDQNLALQWVKDNIQAFGGDPSCVTIFGESAGSMSVGLQMLSPQSVGLFQRGIMQSGAPRGLTLITDTFDMKAVFKGLADMFECQGEATPDLLKCLKEQTEEEFFNKSLQYSSTSPIDGYFFPNVDNEFILRDAFDLTQDEQYLKENGIDGINNIDIMMGFNNNEGAGIVYMTVFMDMPMESLYTSEMFQNFTDSCLLMRSLKKNSVLKKTIEFYYRGADAGSETLETLHPLADMFGDCILTADIVGFAHWLAASPSRSGARYMYVFDQDFAFNNQGPITGSYHGDELVLEFDKERDLAEDFFFKKVNKTEITPEEELLSDKFVQILTSFAKTGNPNPPLKDDLDGGEWLEFTTENEAYLSLSSSPRMVPKVGPFKDRVALWLDLLPELSKLTEELPLEETAAQEHPTPKEEL